MNIIHKITLKCMKENKRRSIVTIIGCAISVALIFSIMITITSFFDMLERDVIATRGSWTTIFANVSGENAEALVKEDEIDKYLIFEDVGTAKFDDSKNLSKPYINVRSCDMHDDGLLKTNIYEGRMPENENEIVITKELLDTSGVKYQINDVITLEFGNRYSTASDQDGSESEDTLLNHSYSYSPNEYFVPTTNKTYQIVGIIDKIESANRDAEYVAYTKLDKIDKNGIYTIYTAFTSIDRSIYAKAAKLQSVYDVHNVEYNSMLLISHGISNNETFLITMDSIVIGMAIIILIGSISLIYNAFAISLAQRSKYLGMLSSVGATKKQKRNSVLFEALMIGVIAIPLGLIIGYVGMSVTYYFLADVFEMLISSSAEMHVIVNFNAVFVSVLFSLFVLVISAWIPARKASKISAISAIRQNEDIKIKANTVKTSYLTRKLLGFEKELALKNLKRNKSRYLATLFSLIISFVLFISAFSFMSYMQQSVSMSFTEINYDVTVKAYNYENDSSARRTQFFKEIANIEGYQTLSIIKSCYNYQLGDAAHINRRQSELMKLYHDSLYSDETAFDNCPAITILGFDTVSLKQYASKAKIPYHENERNVVLLNSYTLKHAYESEDSVMENVIATNYRMNDMIPLKLKTSDDATVEEIQLTAISETTSDFQPSFVTDPNNLYLIVDMETYAQYALTNDEIDYYYTSDDSIVLENNIVAIQNQYMDLEIYVRNFDKGMKQNNQLILMISVFLYGFVTLILLICMANIFNTISTGILLRRQEFAMLKSVGMSRKAFIKMIAYESILYGFKAIIYGIPLGILCSYILYCIIANSFDFAYTVPIVGIVIIALIVLAMVSITMFYSIFKVRNDNIVETIKNENL